MNKEGLISDIISLEWPMFHNVNGEERTGCQNQYDTFSQMRRAQFSAWDEDSLQSYVGDLREAEQCGRNLLREKYIIMMRTSGSSDFELLKDELPAASGQKLKLVADIWAIQLEQTKKVRERFPLIAASSRPLLLEEECGWPSVENYQTAELMTFSEATLEKLLLHIRWMEENGVSFSAEILKNTVMASGFSGLYEAERTMQQRGAI